MQSRKKRGNSDSKHCRPLQAISENKDETKDHLPSNQEEIARQFEVELCWCIEQLQKALKSKKLNKKQVQDHVKALNTLMSSTAPIPQKRQVMRLSFGDYRQKMTEEEKKYLGKVNSKIATVKPDSKSTFVKKSGFITAHNNFKFNFGEVSNKEALTNTSEDNKETVTLNEVAHKSNSFQFTPSNNSFKFAFNIDESAGGC